MILHDLFHGPVRMDSDDPLPDGPGVYVMPGHANTTGHDGRSNGHVWRT